MLRENELPRLFNFDELPTRPYVGNGLTGQHIISVSQFDADKLAYIFRLYLSTRS
jgi:hypothetical protein